MVVRARAGDRASSSTLGKKIHLGIQLSKCCLLSPEQGNFTCYSGSAFEGAYTEPFTEMWKRSRRECEPYPMIYSQDSALPSYFGKFTVLFRFLNLYIPEGKNSQII